MNDLQELSSTAFNKTLFYLKFRSRSQKEIKDYLSKFLYKKNISPDDKEKLINSVISRLLDLKFIDDRKFAKEWVESRISLKPKAKKVIIYELKQKGIDTLVIDKIINQYYTEDQENQLINRIVLKANKKYRLLAIPQRRIKIVSYCLSRGFNYSDIVEIIDELLKKQ